MYLWNQIPNTCAKYVVCLVKCELQTHSSFLNNTFYSCRNQHGFITACPFFPYGCDFQKLVCIERLHISQSNKCRLKLNGICQMTHNFQIKKPDNAEILTGGTRSCTYATNLHSQLDHNIIAKRVGFVVRCAPQKVSPFTINTARTLQNTHSLNSKCSFWRK